MDIEYPSIARRYLATFIDVVFVLFAIIAVSYIFQQDHELAHFVRIGLMLTMFFIYEPLCTSRLCTIGQKIMGVRIRKMDSFEKISILSAYGRIIVKILFGIFSFFTIPLNENKRAIHDFVVGSVVIDIRYVERITVLELP